MSGDITFHTLIDESPRTFRNRKDASGTELVLRLPSLRVLVTKDPDHLAT